MAFDKPTYFELDGATCEVIPTPDGGMTVTKDSGYSLADFMQSGREITKAEYDKLESTDKAVSP